jgi:hypothetical protein
MTIIRGLRGTTLFVAFALNSVVAALVSTIIVEIRLGQKRCSGLWNSDLCKAGFTFVAGFLSAFAVYNAMYFLVGYGSSLTATKHRIPYWGLDPLTNY